MEIVSISEYISRDAVDTELLAMEERFIDNPFALTAIAMAIDKIDKITAADVAPAVHGRWIEPSLEKTKKMGLCGSGLCRCSVCRHEEPVFEEYPKYNYCPHCGAKMDGEEKNNESV